MQLHFLTRLGERVVMRRADPPSTVPGAWRDSAISQLDALVAVDEPLAAQARRRRLGWGAVLAGALLVWSVSAWRQAVDPPRRPDALLAAGQVTSLEAARPPAAEAAPVAAGLVAAVQPVIDTPPAAPAAAEPAAAGHAADEAARRARARQMALALQRKTALLRAEAEAQRRREQQALQEQAEEAARRQQAQDDAARRRALAAASEEAQRLALLREQAARRTVRQTCAAAGGFLAEQFCQARECRRAEHQGDATCRRLREFELAGLRESADH